MGKIKINNVEVNEEDIIAGGFERVKPKQGEADWRRVVAEGYLVAVSDASQKDADENAKFSMGVTSLALMMKIKSRGAFMKKLILIITLLISAPAHANTEVWAVVTDGNGCYSFRIDDYVVERCYKSIEEAWAALNEAHAMRLKQLQHQAKPWADVPSDQDAKNTAEVF